MPVTINGVPSTDLTSGFDLVQVTGTGTDIITGEVSTSSTLNTGDTINGNGKTVLAALLNNPGQTQPVLYLNGVNKLDLLGGGTGVSQFNAAHWQDVHVIKFNATGLSQTLSLMNMAATDRLRVVLGDGFDGELKTDSTHPLSIDGMSLKFAFTNNSSAGDGKGASFRYDHGDIWLKAGLNDSAAVTIADMITAKSVDAAMGDRTFGDLHISYLGADAGSNTGTADFQLTRQASVSAGAGSATVGNTIFGNFVFDYGGGPKDPTADFDLTIKADAGTAGDAIVGDFTVGDVTFNEGQGFSYASFIVNVVATASNGDASVGNITIGDLTVNGGGDNAYLMYSTWEFSAKATTGNASMGDVKIGDLTYNEGPDQSYGSMEFTFDIWSKKSNATVGDITIGDITVRGDNYMANDGGYLSFSIQLSAAAGWGSVATKGDATVGNITVGDISFLGGDNFNVSEQTYSFLAYAQGDSGKATMGDVTFGDLTVDIGRTASWEWDFTVVASQTEASHQTFGGSHVGAVTLGDIAINTGYDATISYSNTVNAEHGKLDAYIVGDLNVVTGDKGDIIFSHYVYGGSIGKVQFGDLHVDLGYDGSMDFKVTASATGASGKWGNLGSFVIGDIDVKVGDDSTFNDFTLYADATRNIGKVVIGDINMTATGAGSVTVFGSWDASNRLGGATIGDVNLKGLDGGKATLSLSFSGDQGAAVKNGITVGDINCYADGDGTATFSMEVSSSKGDIGNVTVGDVTLKLLDTASGSFDLLVTGSNLAGQDIGDITVGDVRFVARGGDSSITATVKATDCDTAGNISIGDVRFVTENKGTSAGNNISIDFNITLLANGDGAITIGDVNVRNINAGVALTANQQNSIGFDISATGGSHDVNIGDVKVAGGWMITAGRTGDDVGTMENLFNITTTGKVTIGNVDYSKYLGPANIGDSSQEWHGMGIIKGAQGDNQIYDTEEQNVIYLNGGDDVIQFTTVQTSDLSDISKIDTVYGFSKIHDELDVSNVSTYFRGGSYSDYDAFLDAARASMNSGNDVFIGSVGEDGFAALDYDGDGVIDHAIRVVGVKTLDTGDFL